MPVLYVVATPIGNLEDISFRAVRILREVKLIAGEDTRSARRLLKRYEIATPVTSYHEFNKKAKLGYLLGRLQDGDLALVSEAGMPGISDPGYELIGAAIGQGIAVVPVPGPSAITTAVAVSGLPANQFVYVGFLPRRKGERRRLLESVAAEPRTVVAFEAPHRLQKALADMLAVLGDRRVAVGRELTKLHEEVFRGTVQEAMAHFATPKGEFTLVIAGREAESPGAAGSDVAEALKRLRRQGVGARESVAALAVTTGLPKRQLYDMWLKLK